MSGWGLQSGRWTDCIFACTPTYVLENGNLRGIPEHLELGILCPGAFVISSGFSLKMLNGSLGDRPQVYVRLRLLFPVPTERNFADWKTAEERNLPAHFRFVDMWKETYISLLVISNR